MSEVLKYTGMLHKLANHVYFRSDKSTPIEDLIQIGYIGVIKALSDPKLVRGAQFDGYVYVRAKGQMLNHLYMKKSPKILYYNDLIDIESTTDLLEELHTERLSSQLRNKINGLNNKEFDIMSQHLYKDMDPAEISLMLPDYSPTQIYESIKWVRKKLTSTKL